MESKSILVVEDDSMTRMIISRVARSVVSEVVEVKNGDEAIAYLESVAPDNLPELMRNKKLYLKVRKNPKKRCF